MMQAVVIHGLRHDARSTTIQNVLAVSRHLSVDKILNVNVFGLVSSPIQADVVIFTYDFLALRTWPIWRELVRRIRPVVESARIRIAMPQDDYSYCDILDQFMCEWGITHVYSPITKDLNVLYPRATAKLLRFGEALTGYVDEAEFERVSRLARPFAQREIDVGQRVRLLSPHLGEQATTKGVWAIRFAELAQESGFRCDVSSRTEDTFLGDDWYRFLGNTKFTVGAKGGASLADPKGRLADRVRRMRIRNPKIQDDEIRRRLKTYSGKEGDFSAISPRMFEAAAMGTCQILRRDDYLEGFEPWKHYVPVDEISRIDDRILAVMCDKDRAAEIVQSSQDFLIRSGNYTYQGFFERVAADVGLTTGKSPQVTDSSAELDDAIGINGEALPWLQSYLARAIASRSLREAERHLSSGRFLVLNDSDKLRHSHIEANRHSVLRWIESIRSKQLIVESVAIPWRSVTSYVRTHSPTTV
jgi:hypothetical protein